MSRRLRKRSRISRPKRRTPPGAMPGTVVVDPAAPKPVINVIEYDVRGCREHREMTVEALAELALRKVRPAQGAGGSASPSSHTPQHGRGSAAGGGAGGAGGGGPGEEGVLWVDVAGLGDAGVIQRIGELFGLHKLELEDIVSSHQRAKLEEYGDHFYIVMRECTCDKSLDQDQVSLCVGKGWVVSFQGKPGDCYEPVRQRIRQSKGRIASCGSDHLAYALIDAVIDSYFPALETLGERLETLEEITTRAPSSATATAIHDVKRDLLAVRRAVWPAREAVSMLLRDDHPLIMPETRIFLRDCYDHLVQLIDVIETYREIGSGLMDIYLASVSNRMNEVMKVLTVIATIFMPLSFIAALYGMNFNSDASALNMPELKWKYGYFFALGLMAASVLSMLYYFYRKGWIFGGSKPANGSEPGADRHSGSDHSG